MAGRTPPRYEAFWIPGADSDLDQDEALRLGRAWLRSQRAARHPLLVAYSFDVVRNARLSGSFPVITPRSRHERGPKPRAVLALWPDRTALDLAQEVALDGALCVIPGGYDIGPWIALSTARNLLDPTATPAALPTLALDVIDAINHIVQFDGHNGLLGAGGKENAIRTLQRLTRDGHRPAPADVEAYARSTGEIGAEGAERLATWLQGVQAGKRFRGTGGRLI